MTGANKKSAQDATASPLEHNKRFLLAFFISMAAMVIAAITYVIVGERFVFDWKTESLIVALVLVGVVVGLWLLQKGEKHTGYGVLFGSLFGLVLGAVAVVLLSLFLIARPVTGIA